MQNGSKTKLGKHCRERWINHVDPTASKFFKHKKNKTKKTLKFKKRENWTFDEDLMILEAIRRMGKKWSWISKQLKGRHENAVKNRYISIIRSLKRNNKQIDLNDIDIIIESFRQNNIEEGFPQKKVKLNSGAENHQLNYIPKKQITNSTIEAQETSSTKNLLVSDKIIEILQNSFISDQKEIKSLHSIPEINDTKNFIYDISNYTVPNIYKKKYQQEEDFSDSPKWKKNYLNLLIRDELDDISQRISSMSISDQLLIEANKILSSKILSSLHGTNSQNSNFHRSFEQNEFFRYSSSNISNEKSFNFMNDNEDKDKKKQVLIPSINDPNFFDDNWNLCSSPQNRLLKSRTTLNENSPTHTHEYNNLNEFGFSPISPRKKKAGTLLYPISEISFSP